MGGLRTRRSRAGRGAAALLSSGLLVGCGSTVPATTLHQSPPATVASPSPATTPLPSSPTRFDVHRVTGSFPAVTALTGTGDRLYWASEASIWRYTPGETEPDRIYQNPTRGALVWDLSARGGAIVFSERLPDPAGTWVVRYLAGDSSEPREVDAGVAERGAPPTVDIDERRLAWAGFDEGSGSPRTFLRVAERSDVEAKRTPIEDDIDARLLWYPQLDDDTLWYSTIDPDFEGTGEGDAFRIETLDLADARAVPAIGEPSNAFEAVVTPDFVAWKSVDPGFSALTWGQIHVLDRRSDEELVIATRANHPSLGSRFVTFEEFFHRQLLVYDLATRRTIEIPGSLPDGKGTIGVPVIADSLLGYSISVRGEKSVFWVRLPD